MFNLNIPQASTAGLFNAPYSGPGDTADAIRQGFDRGTKRAEAYRAEEVKQKVRELVKKHDITTPQGKLALVRELSESGLAEEVQKFNQDFQSRAGQVLDTPDGYQVADPAYGRAHPMEGGAGLSGGSAKPGAGAIEPQYPGGAAPGGAPETGNAPSGLGFPGGWDKPAAPQPGQGMPSHQSQKRIDETELREGFSAWRDHIAKPFGEARQFKFSAGDKNRLRSTLPKELEGHAIVEDYFRTLESEPAPRAGARGGSGLDSSGVSKNLEDVDAEIASLTSEMETAEQNKPARGDFSGQKQWHQNRFQARKRLDQLKSERRRWQSRGGSKSGSAREGAPVAVKPRGKLTDPNKAREYLGKAGGDPEKARALARKDGWAF